MPCVLTFGLGVAASVGLRLLGPVAQWESVRFTRGRSLVRSQPGPPKRPHTALRYRRVTTRWDSTSTGAPSRLHQVAGRENATTSA